MKNELIIKKIKTIIEENDGVSIAETGESCPVLKMLGKDEYILIEGIYFDNVLATKYIHETECNNYKIPYEELPNRLLKEILNILKTHLENGFG